MKMKKILLFLMLGILMGVKPAFANQPPGPMVSLPMILILPVMILLTLIGGGYGIRRRLADQKPKTPRGCLYPFLVVMLMVL